MLVPYLSELLSNEGKDGVYSSLGFLTPQTEKGEEKLWNEHLPRLMKTDPLFLDVTWGAGSRTSDKTMRISKQIQDKYGIAVNMHLTCTNIPAGLLKETLDFCYENGMRNILALRGDPPEGEEWKPNDDDEALRVYWASQTEEMVQAIQAADIGIKHFHFYVVNSPDSAMRILDKLNLAP
ncbi:Methylenetetrahydrofolate reductase [Trypanosoma melophagium]|uniref:Methylenetetrahydrofolate reductase n=1 Tax=Trypanosoma melophagium TaxID=715481 RepID=UPI003519D921|nr:Methylenetetrahydrofolate reductase [Trypanosoma melophagium]